MKGGKRWREREGVKTPEERGDTGSNKNSRTVGVKEKSREGGRGQKRERRG